MSFEKGDTVVLHDENSEFDGMTGDILQVTETMFGDFIYTIQFDEGRETGISEDIIDAVETDDGSMTSGPTGVGAPSEAMSRADSGADPTEPGTEEWSFENGGLVDSSPTVVDGTVYVGSNDNNLYAVDAASGHEEWAFETGDCIKSSPTVVNGTVYVGSYDHHLYAVNAESGREEWTFDTGANIYSSPTVINGTVYVGWCSHLDSRDNHLYAVDAKSGRKEWALAIGGGSFRSFETGYNKTYETETSTNTPPTVVAGVIYFGCRDSHLYAVDTHGKQKWRFETEGYVNGSPTVADGIVYAGSAGGILYAVDAASGHKEWGFETGPMNSSPVVADGTVYVGGGDLYAVDMHSGQQEWRFKGGQVEASPMVVDGTAYVGSHDGTLYAVDTESGREEWAFEAGDNILSSPTVVDGTVYVVSSGALYAVAAQRGTRGETDERSEAATEASGPRDGPDSKTALQEESNSPAHPSPERAGGSGDLSYDAIQREATLGRGAADVYAARIPAETGPRRVVLKEPRFAGKLDAATREDFLDEARYWAQVTDHPHVVDLVAWGDDPHPWLVTEYLDGGDLSEQPANLDEGLWICARIADALHEAHTLGLRHFDLKPENVLLRRVEDNPWDVPKVSDWGLARFQLDHSGRLSSFTPQYGAPEQFLPDEFGGLDNRTDLYQFGLVLYELITGEHPFPDRSGAVVAERLREAPTRPSELDGSLPARLDEIVGRLLAPQPADRYDSAAVVRNVLDRLRTGEAVGQEGLADRADLYANALEYARGESLRECQRWAEEMEKFVKNNPVDDCAYQSVREKVSLFVEEWFAGHESIYGGDHDLVVGGDVDLRKKAPELSHDIADVAEAVRRLYLRAG